MAAELPSRDPLALAGLGGPLTARRDSLGQRVYKSVRLAMLKGELDSSRLYSEDWLAEKLNVSRTPIREALRQLEYEGLIEIIPQRGFRLRVISDAEVREFYILREMLESYVVTTLCEATADSSLDSSISDLDVILERQRRCVSDAAEFVAWDEEFHLALATLANQPRTARIIASLRGILWLLGTQIIGNHVRRESVLEEHAKIIRALLAHDCVAAAAAMTAHIRETARLAIAMRPVIARRGNTRQEPTANGGPERLNSGGVADLTAGTAEGSNDGN